MKKFIKNNLKVIIAFTVGLIISGVTVYAISADQITYNDTTVAGALNDLYTQASASKIIWVNENPSSALSSTTLNIDLEQYQSIIVLGYYAPTLSGYTGYVKIDKNSSGTLRTYYKPDDYASRSIVVGNNSIQILEGHAWNNNVSNEQALPMYIIGVK